VNAPLDLVFKQPTIAGLVEEVEALRNADLGLYKDTPASTPGPQHKAPPPSPVDYAQDYLNLLQKLHESYAPLPADFSRRSITVFLTGATGFLGAFILRDLLSRHSRVKKVILLIRAADSKKALQRLRQAMNDRAVWDEEWVKSLRLEIVAGDLSHDHFGLKEEKWARIAAEADVLIHNGAFVRCSFQQWIYDLINLLPRSIGCIRTKNFGRPTSSRP
jgi:L-aminoadipate-semialdehyde dehydrogenase